MILIIIQTDELKKSFPIKVGDRYKLLAEELHEKTLKDLTTEQRHLICRLLPMVDGDIEPDYQLGDIITWSDVKDDDVRIFYY